MTLTNRWTDRVTEYHAAWYQANRERLLAKAKARREAKRAEIRAWKRQYQQDHKEELAAKKRAHYVKNRERISAAHRDYYLRKAPSIKDHVKAYRDSNPVKTKTCIQRWIDANRARLAAAKKAYALAHPLDPLHRRDLTARRRAREVAATIGKIDLKQILRESEGVCGICRQPIGDGPFHFDHIMPLARGGAHAQNNIQVAHPRCNLMKSAKVD